MPALPNVTKVLRCDFFSTVGPDTRVRDRIFFSFSGAGPNVADLNTLATTIDSAWAANIISLQPSTATLTSIQLTDLTSATGAQTVKSVSRVGNRAVTALPSATSIIIKFKIARRYRGGHPRFYLYGGGAQDTLNPSTWLSAFTGPVATQWAAFIAACELTPPTNLGVLVHVNVSYFSGFTNKTFPSGRIRPVPTVRGTPVVDSVVSYSVNPIIGSQRRRNLQSA
jgi:hypothetical protein